MNTKKTVPIFYACDDAFIKYTIVSITSMKQNASREFFYDIHILSTTASEEMKARALALADDDFSVTFDDVTAQLDSLTADLPIRDYYSKTTYYRFFIAEMFKNIDKAIYIDSDTVVLGDISELYMQNIDSYLLGAAHEQAMVQVNEYGTYVEQNLGIDRNNYFNAGVMLINCRRFREERVLERFLKLLPMYNFVVTQDEDYLNVICRDKVYFIDGRWNTEMIGEIPYPEEEYKIIHYIMISKPWHYRDCRCGHIFWKYAELTDVYSDIQKELELYTDEERARDIASCDRLLETAVRETYRDNKFVDVMIKNGCSEYRRGVLEKIESYERQGIFDKDAEDDPETKPILPGEVDYCQRKLSERIWARIAFRRAQKYLKKILSDGGMVVDGINGIENLNGISSGAVITCNHFHPHDSFAVQLAYEASVHRKKKKLFRVIREGNYTSYPGFFGFLMRHCNTLPLSSNRRVMAEFSSAVDGILKNGDLVVIYPEQSMWYNYRKPKPLKEGAFYLAAKAMVPVIPVFITMRSTDKLDGDGYPVQSYTINILPPIYPDREKGVRENTRYMMKENYAAFTQTYENVYGISLRYTTEK